MRLYGQARIYLQKRLVADFQKIELGVADALSLQYDDSTFDAVFANFVLHHVEKRPWQFKNIPHALREIKRVLKLGGVFVYTEVFKKKRIREYLEQTGFELSYPAMDKRVFGIKDLRIYRKEL